MIIPKNCILYLSDLTDLVGRIVYSEKPDAQNFLQNILSTGLYVIILPVTVGIPWSVLNRLGGMWVVTVVVDSFLQFRISPHRRNVILGIENRVKKGLFL